MAKTDDVTAEVLVATMAAGLDSDLGFGTFSASIYDTAWVAMVDRPGPNAAVELVFPECFEFLLRTQEPDGSWSSSSSSTLDAILNTMAALLALQRRALSASEPLSSDLAARCAKAEVVIESLLRSWDIDSCDRVGFEVIVPALIRLLEQYGYRFERELSGTRAKSLTELFEKKMAKMFPILLSEKPTTLVHSLEAFAGRLDFDRVKHHLSPNGDMLCSPSSTAAYLMFASTWDEQAEGYLRSVVAAMASDNGTGGVPSAFPTHIFEMTWVLTTLLEAGYVVDDLGQENVLKIKDYLIHILEAQGGMVGFAPHALPDSDDLSMTISVLTLLGESVSVDGLLSHFETPTHFVSYPGERNASFSVNCNVLLCLLRRDDVAMFTAQAVKAATFLAQIWYDSTVKDKWNTSKYYPMMLLAKAFIMFLDRLESNALDRSQVPEDLLREKIPVILFDVLLKILDDQQEDGSWSQQREPTAYAILALDALRRLSWFEHFLPEIQSRMDRGKAYLLRSQDQWRDGASIWIEKVAYSSSNLSLAYCLAATRAAQPPERPLILGAEIRGLLSSSPRTLQSFQKFFSRVSAFSNTPSWQLELWILQAAHFSPWLGRTGLDFNIPMTASDNKYLAYIPFTWISICNGSKRISLSAQWEMMVCSVLNYQIDDFMEFAVALKHGKNIEYLKNVVRRLCASGGLAGFCDVTETKSPQKRKFDETHKGSGPFAAGELTPPELDTDRPLGSVEDTLAQYIKHFLQHPKVQQSPPWMQTWLAQQLQRCLIAHLTHLQDCADHATSSESGNGRHAPKPWTYFDWVHSTAADNTTAKFSFVFFMCLIFGERGDRLLGGEKGTTPSYFPRYVAEDMCQHLATMCRQQNDFGSVARDRAEGVLNSMDFEEFGLGTGGVDGGDTTAAGKKMLLQAAEYERACVENAMTELGRWLDPDALDAIRVLVEVTDLYGQMYILKDRGPGT